MPAGDDFPSGPAVGERLPDFTLPDQRGTNITFDAAAGPAYLVVVRSTRW